MEHLSTFFYDTSSSEILNVIMNQETKKACGYDEISNKIIKKSSDIVAPFLKILFNACLRSSQPSGYLINFYESPLAQAENRETGETSALILVIVFEIYPLLIKG